MNGKWLAAFALASLCGVAHADPNTRLPCTTDNTDNCYTPYVHPDSAQGGGAAGGAVYGTDATGAAPTKPPLFIAGVDGNGKIVPFTITANGLQFFATSLPLPTGASTDASVQAVKTTLGSPFQAGGSVGNTGFNALQNGAANSATNQFFEQTVGPSMQAPGIAPTIVRGIQGAPGGIPVPTSPAAATCTDTPKALNSTSTTLLPAGTYKSVNYMNIGTNPMTFVEGTSAAVVGGGMAISGASAAGLQGGSYSYTTPPSNAVQAISAAGTTVIVKVCN